MKIYLAKYYGFCSGVRLAVKKANEFLEENKEAEIVGDLIHNQTVIDDFARRGLKKIDDYKKIFSNNIIIRAHGETIENTKLLEDNHKNICDTTCIKVKNIHELVEKYSNIGYNVIIAGDKEHPEVKAIVSHSKTEAIVIKDLDEAKEIIGLNHIAFFAQSTFIHDKFDKMSKCLEEHNEDVLVFNTICNATENRQKAVMELANKVDMVLVFGSNFSSNTKKLYEISKTINPKTYLLENIHELDMSLIKPDYNIGITAGASVPDDIIKEAIKVMENLNHDETMKKEDAKETKKDEMIKAIDDSFKRISRGEIIEGEVLYVTDNDVSVNINFRSDGIIKKEDLAEEDVNPKDLYKQGDKIKVYVVKIDDGEGNVVLSTKKLKEMEVWEKIEEVKERDEVVSVKVKSVTKGGLIVNYSGIQGFIPASLVSVRYKENLEEFVGQNLDVVIIDVDINKRRLVFSRKAVEKKELDKKREEAWENIKEGEIVKGIVARIVDYGAFIDLGGIDGLVHITDLTWGRIRNPKEVLKQGEEIEVKVLSVDKERNRISLGLKQTVPEPWTVFTEKYHEGDVVEVEVVNIESYGAFVRIMEGVDALLHVSQISHKRVNDPKDVLKVGDRFEVMITEIHEDKKVSVSKRRLEEPVEEEQEYEEEAPAAEEVHEEEKPEVEEKEVKEAEVKELPVQNDDLSEDMGALFKNAIENSESEEQ